MPDRDYVITAPTDCIVKVELHYQPSYFEVIDDLAFNTAGPPGTPDTDPPVVSIETPASGIFLDFPDNGNAFPLAGTVYEAVKLRSLTMRVESGGRVREGAVNLSHTPPTYTFGSPNVHGFIGRGRSLITVAAEDYGGNTGSDTVEVWYEPLTGTAELLILTPTAFRGPLAWLRDWKNSSGLSCHIMTLEGLQADPRFSGARDIQERIKRAMAHAYRHHGTRYVMLVGDGDAFPVRYTREGREGISWGVCRPASDLYYADLFKPDGSFDDWDANGDGVYGDWWGAPEEGMLADDFDQINIDACDLRPDIAVGRIPASTVQEVSTYAQKVMSYESQSAPYWFDRVLLFSGPREFPGDEDVLDSIAANTMRGFDFTKSYRPEGLEDWTPSQRSSYVEDWRDMVGESLSRGVGFAFCVNHGERDVCGVYTASALDGLQNAARLPVVATSACNTGKFIHWSDFYMNVGGEFPRDENGGLDRDRGWPDPRPEPAPIQPAFVDNESMAERFLVQSPSGAIGFIGPHSGTNAAGPPICQLVPEAWDRGRRRLGDMWNDALTRFINTRLYSNHDFSRDPFQSHHIHKFVLFGDPSLRMGGAPAEVMQADEGEGLAETAGRLAAQLRESHAGILRKLACPGVTATGTVTIRGEARPGARVAIREGRRLLAQATADADGRFRAELRGLTEGTHSLSVQAAPPGARRAETSHLLVQVQTAAPTGRSIRHPETCGPTGFVVTGATQYDGTYVELLEGKKVLASDYSQHGGVFVLRPARELPPGRHVFCVRLSTAAGRETTLPGRFTVRVTRTDVRGSRKGQPTPLARPGRIRRPR